MKYYIIRKQINKFIVASFAEAWIEILIREGFRTLSGSPPSRRRGLKLIACRSYAFVRQSPPSRRRGLKSKSSASCIVPLIVASFAEAWIEILRGYMKGKKI